jgi:hypothetical protein
MLEMRFRPQPEALVTELVTPQLKVDVGRAGDGVNSDVQRPGVDRVSLCSPG